MCIYGYAGTIPVTMGQCIARTEAVRRAAPNVFLLGDMPFMSYQICDEKAVRNADGQLLVCGADGVDATLSPAAGFGGDGGVEIRGTEYGAGITVQAAGIRFVREFARRGVPGQIASPHRSSL